MLMAPGADSAGRHHWRSNSATKSTDIVQGPRMHITCTKAAPNTQSAYSVAAQRPARPRYRVSAGIKATRHSSKCDPLLTFTLGRQQCMVVPGSLWLKEAGCLH